MRSKHKRGRKDHSAIRSLQDYGESDTKVGEKERCSPAPTILVSFFKVKSKRDPFNAIFKTSGRFQKRPFHKDVLEAVVTLLRTQRWPGHASDETRHIQGGMAVGWTCFKTVYPNNISYWFRVGLAPLSLGLHRFALILTHSTFHQLTTCQVN